MDQCFKGWSQETGNNSGRCCCNCDYQRPLMAHPWNKIFGKGSINQQIGWVCMIPDPDFYPQVVFFDNSRDHGMCECHNDRDYSKYSANRTMEALKRDVA